MDSLSEASALRETNGFVGKKLFAFFDLFSLNWLSGVIFALIILQLSGFVTQSIAFDPLFDWKAIFNVFGFAFYRSSFLGIQSRIAFWIVSTTIVLCVTICCYLIFSSFLERRKSDVVPLWCRAVCSTIYLSSTIGFIPLSSLLFSFTVCGHSTGSDSLFFIEPYDVNQCSNYLVILQRLFAGICLSILLIFSFLRFILVHEFSPVSRNRYSISHSHCHSLSLLSFTFVISVFFLFPTRYWLFRSLYLLASFFVFFVFLRFLPFYRRATNLKVGVGLGFLLGNSLAFFSHSVFIYFYPDNPLFNLVLFSSCYLICSFFSFLLFKHRVTKYERILSKFAQDFSSDDEFIYENISFENLSVVPSTVHDVELFTRGIFTTKISESPYLELTKKLYQLFSEIFPDSNQFLIYFCSFQTFFLSEFVSARTSLQMIGQSDSDLSLFEKWRVYKLFHSVEDLKRRVGAGQTQFTLNHRKVKLINQINQSFKECLDVISSFWDALLAPRVNLSTVSNIVSQIHISRESLHKLFINFFEAGYEDYSVVKNFANFLREVEHDYDKAEYLDSCAASMMTSSDQNSDGSRSHVTSTTIDKSVISLKTNKKQSLSLSFNQNKGQKSSFLKLSVFVSLMVFVILLLVSVVLGLNRFKFFTSKISQFHEVNHVNQVSQFLPFAITQMSFFDSTDQSNSSIKIAHDVIASSQHFSYHLSRLSTGSSSLLPTSSCPSPSTNIGKLAGESSSLFTSSHVITELYTDTFPPFLTAHATSAWELGLSMIVYASKNALAYLESNFIKLDSNFVLLNAETFSIELSRLYNTLLSGLSSSLSTSFSLYSLLILFSFSLTSLIVFLLFSRAFSEITNSKTTALNAYLLIPRDDPANALASELARFTIRQMLLTINHIITTNSSRKKIIELLKNTFLRSPRFSCVWAAFEPDMFDDSDADGAKGHDSTGRFTPMCFKSAGAIKIDCMQNVDSELFYNGPKETDSLFKTEPYVYEFEGKPVKLITVSAAIKNNGQFVGAVGLDIFVDDSVEEDLPASDDVDTNFEDFTLTLSTHNSETNEKIDTKFSDSSSLNRSVLILMGLVCLVLFVILTINSLKNENFGPNFQAHINQTSLAFSTISELFLIDFQRISNAQRYTQSGDPYFLFLYFNLVHSNRRTNLLSQVARFRLSRDQITRIGQINSFHHESVYLEMIALSLASKAFAVDDELITPILDFDYDIDKETFRIQNTIKFNSDSQYSSKSQDFSELSTIEQSNLSRNILSNDRYHSITNQSKILINELFSEIFDEIFATFFNDAKSFSRFNLLTIVLNFGVLFLLVFSLLLVIFYEKFNPLIIRIGMIVFYSLLILSSAFVLFTNFQFRINFAEIYDDVMQLESMSNHFSTINNVVIDQFSTVNFFLLSQKLHHFDSFIHTLDIVSLNSYSESKFSPLYFELSNNFHLYNFIAASTRLLSSVLNLNSIYTNWSFNQKFDWNISDLTIQDQELWVISFDNQFSTNLIDLELSSDLKYEMSLGLIFGRNFEKLSSKSMTSILSNLLSITDNFTSNILSKFSSIVQFNSLTWIYLIFIFIFTIFLLFLYTLRQRKTQQHIKIHQHLQHSNLSVYKRQYHVILTILMAFFLILCSIGIYFLIKTFIYFQVLFLIGRVAGTLESVGFNLLNSPFSYSNSQCSSCLINKLEELSQDFSELIHVSRDFNDDFLAVLFNNKVENDLIQESGLHSLVVLLVTSITTHIQSESDWSTAFLSNLIDMVADSRVSVFNAQELVISAFDGFTANLQFVVYAVAALSVFALIFSYFVFNRMFKMLKKEQQTVLSLFKMLPSEAIDSVEELQLFLAENNEVYD
ncbi:hypothetical protein RCL1_001270 [Eukaryota sp. TZLM3-RCL]